MIVDGTLTVVVLVDLAIFDGRWCLLRCSFIYAVHVVFGRARADGVRAGRCGRSVGVLVNSHL